MGKRARSGGEHAAVDIEEDDPMPIIQPGERQPQALPADSPDPVGREMPR